MAIMIHVTSLEQLPSAINLLLNKMEELSRKVDNVRTVGKPTDELLNIEQASKMLNLTVQTIYALIRDKKIPYMKPTGRRVYFSKNDLETWIRASRHKTTHEIEREAGQWLASMAK